MKTAEKIKIADTLRKESNSAMKLLERVTSNWTKELVKAKTPKERTIVNQKFTDLYAKADKKENKAYAKYYNFVDKNFEKTAVQNSVRGGVFTEKEFINRLKKETMTTAKVKPTKKK